jgi:hypothetical protein
MNIGYPKVRNFTQTQAASGEEYERSEQQPLTKRGSTSTYFLIDQFLTPSSQLLKNLSLHPAPPPKKSCYFPLSSNLSRR